MSSFFKTPFLPSNSGSAVSIQGNSNSKSDNNGNGHGNANATKTRRSLSYILNTSNSVQSKGHHSIGVNSLLYNKSDQSLISGGRDGQISIWKFDDQCEESRNSETLEGNVDIYDNFRSHNDIREHINSNIDNDEELERIETSINNGVSSLKISKNQTVPKCNHNSYLHHFGWINDMKLLGADGEIVASCSNDLSIKLWNYQTNTKSTLGYHDDYIKKIGYTKSYSNQLVSGGLDKVIKVWDIKKGQSISHFKFPGFNDSIYSLDVNKDLIICSGPSNVITILDRRDMTKPVNTFVGHTDNVRSLILKSDLFLSGSSDASIKLWDLRTTRVLRNFEMHSSPVWSLYTPEYTGDNFSIFYSADKSGLLLKNDLRASNLYSNNMNEGYFNYKVNESMGISTIIANVNYYNNNLTNTTNSSSSSNPGLSNNNNFESSFSGINDLVESEDLGMIWTATSPSTHDPNTNFISSWSIPQTGKLVVHQGLVLNRKLASLYKGDEMSVQAENQSINDAEDLVSQLSGDDLDQIDNALFSNAQGLDKLVLSHDEEAEGEEEVGDVTIDAGMGRGNVTFAMHGEEEEEEEEEDEDEQLDAFESLGSATCFVGILGDPNTHFLLTRDYFNSEYDVDVDGDVKSRTSLSELDPFTSPKKDEPPNFIIQVSRRIMVNNEYIEDEDVLLLPFNTRPISCITGTSGLIRSRMLNDRRHVATMDQSGCIYIFDILLCKMVKRVDNELSMSSIESTQRDSDVDNSIDDAMSNMNLSDRFEAVCERLQSQESLPSWCSVQVKCGQLFITLKENNFASCEIYADDFVEYYDELAPLNETLLRVNLGKIIIKTFFQKVLTSVLKERGVVLGGGGDTDAESVAMSKAKNGSIDVVKAETAGQARAPGPVSPQPPVQTTRGTGEKKQRGGFFGRLKSSGNGGRDKDVSETDVPMSADERRNAENGVKYLKYMELVDKIETSEELVLFLRNTRDLMRVMRMQEQFVERERDFENMPVITYEGGQNVLVVINEETGHETRPAFTIYLDQLVGDSNVREEIVWNLPVWIAKALVLNVYHLTPAMTTKISFKLIPLDMPRVDEEGNILRLNAVGTLRVSRILEFIANKMPVEARGEAMELTCRDVVLSERDTLGTAKARIWKDAAEVELVYRKRAV